MFDLRHRISSKALAIVAGALLGGSVALYALPADGPAVANAEAKKMKIIVVTDEGKGAEKVEIESPGALKDGETRELTNSADGKKVTVTRRGEKLVIKTAAGKEIEIETPEAEGHTMAYSTGDGGEVRVIKRFIASDGKATGEPMVWVQKSEGKGCSCSCGHGMQGHGMQGHGAMKDCAMEHQGKAEGGMKDCPMDHQGKAEGGMKDCPMEHGEMGHEAMQGGAAGNCMGHGAQGQMEKDSAMHGGDAPAMHAMMMEHVIEQLQATKSFQELDAATREKVIKALHEAGAGAPVAKRVEVKVIEKKEEKKP